MGFLMKSQRAMLHHMLEQHQFNPTDFEFVSSTAQAATHEKGDKIRLRGTDYYFAVYPNENDNPYISDQFFVEYSPGDEKIWELELCRNWLIVCSTFAAYLSFLHRETTTSDPWDEPGIIRTTERTEEETLIHAGNLFTGQRLAKLIFSEATESLDILDPYIGSDLFDRIHDAEINVAIRILTGPKAKSSLSYYKAFKETYPNTELRFLEESKLHDRFILIDKASGYQAGHSLKDLGKKDTRISTVDNIKPLLALFEQRWSEAKVAD
jgi:hypothetical protein